MDGFLFSIAASGACAIGVVIAKKTEHWHRQQRHSRRRKQLLIQALHEVGRDRSIARAPRLSDRQFEMELLLMDMSAKAEILTEALAFEAEIGRKAIEEDTENPACLSQWQQARRAVQQAQEVYSEALDDYLEFLHSLPPPLRAAAAERGAFAMAISPA
jgi:hypothetical protein